MLSGRLANPQNPVSGLSGLAYQVGGSGAARECDYGVGLAGIQHSPVADVSGLFAIALPVSRIRFAPDVPGFGPLRGQRVGPAGGAVDNGCDNRLFVDAVQRGEQAGTVTVVAAAADC